MANAITIQALQDASLDAKSLEEVVNGNESKQVTTRKGETYPSVKKAIKTLFENGGLPATPFTTKALMESSALVDGDYAMVTYDTTNNGLYIKEAGTWVKSEFDMQTLVEEKVELAAKDIKDRGIGAYDKTNIPLENNEAGYIDISGVYVPSEDWVTSSKIPVKKGECYLLEGDNIFASLSADRVSVFNLYNSSDEFIGSLHNSRATLADLENVDLNEALKVGNFFDKSNLLNYSTIIPEDGYIKVTKSTTKARNMEASLSRVSFDYYTQNSVIYCKEESLKAFEDVLHSVIADKYVANNGKIGYRVEESSVSESGERVYKGVYVNGSHTISKQYPVSAGEYIHYSVQQDSGTNILVFEDELGNYLGTQNIATEYTTGRYLSGKSAFNIKSAHTGYFRIISLTRYNNTPLVGVTSREISYERFKLTDKFNEVLFYPSSGKTNEFLGDSHIETVFKSSFLFGNNSNPNVLHTLSNPYFLAKGEVLSYTLRSTVSPLFAIAIKADEQFTGSTLLPKILEETIYCPIKATEIYTESDREYRNSLTNVPHNRKGETATVHYCNEDEDTLIMFLRPNVFYKNYFGLNLSTNYEIKIRSIEEYKASRNAELTERFKIISGYGLTGYMTNLNMTGGVSIHKGLSTYPPVLLFKGEVLNYATNFFGKSDVNNLSVSRGVKSKSQVYSDLSYSYGWSASNSDTFEPFWNREISLDDKISYHYNQILALETCIVIPSVSVLATDGVTDLDVNNLIRGAYFEPRIIDLKDAKVGDNLEPLFVPMFTQSINYSPEEKSASISNSVNGRVDFITSFVPKNSNLEFSYWASSSTGNLWVNKDISHTHNMAYPLHGWTPTVSKGKNDIWANIAVQDCLVKSGAAFAEDSIVLLNSRTRIRDVQVGLYEKNGAEVSNVIDTEALSKQMEKYEHSLRTISDEEYAKKYEVTDKTFINIPNHPSLVFDLREPSSVSLDDYLWGILNIRIGDEVLAVVKVRTENQGQSSAGYNRKNVNLEFFNNEGEEVYIAFGDLLAQEEVVLKSYQLSDRGNWRDSVACDLWLQVRNANPHPIGGVFPAEVFHDLSKPTNQTARGTPYAFPVEFHRGGEFWGAFTLRAKKKRENYCAVKKNKNHILIQASWQLGSFSWDNLNMTMFEVRNPSIDDYEEGDATLPTGYEQVQANITRLIDWMKGCFRGTISFADTYQDYFDIDSLIDYCLMLEFLYSWDGVFNNFILGTFDGKIWRVYQYDTDHTFGGYTAVNNNVGGPFSPFKFDNRGDFFNKMGGELIETKTKRYHEIRDLGVIDIKRVQDMIMDCRKSINDYALIKDIEYWGEYLPKQDVPSGVQWTYDRISFMDAFYGYLDKKSGVVFNAIYNPPTVAAGASLEAVFEVSNAKVGDKYISVFGFGWGDLEHSLECKVDGEVTLTTTNNTEASINLDTSFINLYKV